MSAGEAPVAGYNDSADAPGGRTADQERWYAHISDQARAVQPVREASGAMNDASFSVRCFVTAVELGEREGAVRRIESSSAD